MKKLFSVLAISLFISGLVGIWSCKPGDNTDPNSLKPTLNVTGSTIGAINIDKNYIFHFKIVAAANQNTNSDLSTLKMHILYSTGGTTDIDFPIGSGEKKAVTKFDTLKITNAPIGQIITITFTVTDKAAAFETAQIVATVVDYSDVYRSDNDTLGDQSNLTRGSFLDIKDNQIYLMLAAKALASKIDFCYAMDLDNAATIGAPSDDTIQLNFNSTNGPKGWTPKNVTYFKPVATMDDAAFSAQTASSIQALFTATLGNGTTHTGSLVDPNTGQQSYYVYKIVNTGKYGLLRVELLIDANPVPNDNYIVISTITQK